MHYRLRKKTARVIHYTIMAALAFFIIFPILWMFSSALRPIQEIFAYTSPLSWKTFLPVHPTLDNFSTLLFAPDSQWLRYILNTLFVTSLIILVGGLINALAAYAFARLKFPGRDALFVLTLVTVIVPFEAIALPLVLVVKQLGWIDSFQALIVPALANGFNIFLLRQFFIGIPNELEEAAIMDGASRLQVFFGIIVPLSWPVLITTGLLSFQSSWDAFLWPLIATSSPQVRLIQVAISMLIGQDFADWNHLFAATALAALVPLLIFICLQRYYQQGIATTGLKE
ncbi:MAG: carbohydrate ABC transporter permease [Anaerolineaceae bacterium]|nr:carbohydrate ABC transporter permease [Anaerolineaceae bacterium]